MKLVFEFTEEMMTIALLANNWESGWKNGSWVHKDMNADYGGFSLKEAFGRLLLEKNLVGINYQEHFRVE